MAESVVFDAKGLAEFNFDTCRMTYLLNPQSHGLAPWEKLSYPKALDLASSNGLKLIFGKERDENKDYQAYREKFHTGVLNHLKGKLIAYRKEQIVGVDSEGNLEGLLGKMKGLLGKEPVLIIPVGMGYGMHLQPNS